MAFSDFQWHRSCFIEIVKFLLNIALALIFSLTVVCRGDDTSAAVLQEINLARTNPHQYAQFILADADSRSKADTRAMEEAVKFLNSVKPLPPLAFSNGLSMSAMAHVADQGAAGATGHNGSDHSSPWDRMARYGQKVGYVGENISYGVSNARQIVISLIVDAGVSGRGHRKNLFMKNFGVVGIACGSHAHYGTMCVMDFASQFIENSRYSDARKPAPASVSTAWNGPI